MKVVSMLIDGTSPLLCVFSAGSAPLRENCCTDKLFPAKTKRRQDAQSQTKTLAKWALFCCLRLLCYLLGQQCHICWKSRICGLISRPVAARCAPLMA